MLFSCGKSVPYGAGDVAGWESACLAFTRPWFSLTALQRQSKVSQAYEISTREHQEFKVILGYIDNLTSQATSLFKKMNKQRDTRGS